MYVFVFQDRGQFYSFISCNAFVNSSSLFTMFNTERLSACSFTVCFWSKESLFLLDTMLTIGGILHIGRELQNFKSFFMLILG